MEQLGSFLDFILHVNVYLDSLASNFGGWIYVILFLIIFCETGLVVTPFLPGDSLLFAAGAIAAGGEINIFLLLIVLILAAILGDTANYWIGRFAGEKIIERYPRLIKPKHLEKTRQFFERYGAKTIVLCRFVPIVRTLAPFVAGAGEMTYARFMKFNVAGAFIWVLLIAPAGYFFANVNFVKENFSIVLLAVIVISFFPPLFEIIRERRKSNRRKDLQS